MREDFLLAICFVSITLNLLFHLRIVALKHRVKLAETFASHILKSLFEGTMKVTSIKYDKANADQTVEKP